MDKLVLRPTPPTALVVDGVPLVVFDPEGYENIARNLQDILSLVHQQDSVITYYEKCIARER